MKIANFFNANNSGKGMTLVETIMAIGVAVILLASISFAIYRVFDTNWRGTTHMVAVKEVENAVHFVSRDVERAQYPEGVTPVPEKSFADVPLVLSWQNEFDNDSGTVTYTIDSDNNLVRSYDNGDNMSTSIIAQHINPITTTWELLNPLKQNLPKETEIFLSINITASVGGARPATETRSFRIIPRSKP